MPNVSIDMRSDASASSFRGAILLCGDRCGGLANMTPIYVLLDGGVLFVVIKCIGKRERWVTVEGMWALPFVYT